jgi:AcrR family transcriptional regulator
MPDARPYHHGDLREAALTRALAIIDASGPDALGLRELARDLGVSHPALRYWFRTPRDLKAMVASRALHALLEHVRGALGTRTTTRALAREWTAYAAAHPALYRLLSGEGWHTLDGTDGMHGGDKPVPSPRRALEDRLRSDTRRAGHPAGDMVWAREQAILIHAFALARIDGVPADAVDDLIGKLIQEPR